MIKSKHFYIDNNPVKATDTALILGTIHPHNTQNFLVEFFYGNKNSLWSILNLAFPNLDFKTVDGIQKTLSQSNIWISDMIRSCEREDEKVTQDKLLQKIELNTEQIRDGIINSKIDTIFFTSGFGKNNAVKLFCDAFSIQILNKNVREFYIEEHIFGRKIRGVILFSPSGQANIGISKNSLYLGQRERYTSKTPVNEFKVATYKESFKNHFGNL
jgi:hypothetical protein